jgi:hypothetical protein
MTAPRDDGGAACAWCERQAHIRQGRILLCGQHYRIASMRSRSTRDGKVTPSRAEIEALIPDPFTCVGCDRPMTWLRADEPSRQATLQHDRDGRIRILCLGCNTRHAQHPGDSFYSIPKGMKRCPDCSQVLPEQTFAVDRSRPAGRKTYCRECSSARFKKWSAQHAA